VARASGQIDRSGSWPFLLAAVVKVEAMTWKFIRNPNGNFAVYRDGKELRKDIPERWLEEEVCVKYGFCGQEFEKIFEELSRVGQCVVTV
jgi:hypothetical protein